MWTGIALVASILSVLLVGFFMYRTGQIDNLIANQIVGTLAQYGIRAEIEEFHTEFGARTVVMQGVELYDAETGEKLGQIDRLEATVRIEDLYALNLLRNVNLAKLVIDGLELWVAFDEQGRSNFRNLHLPPPDPNSRILFSYSTAQVELKNSIVHYGDERHEISGAARNIKATVQPDDPSAPAESRMNQIMLSLSDSTFTYDGRPINNIDIEARARVDQTRAEIQSLVLRSPVAEAQLQGTLDDWRALRYQLQVTSNVDLTQISETFQTEAALRGAGQFTGTVKGEGDQYQVEGQIISDALAADNIRLKNLNVTARARGEGTGYEAQGSAVAELLTAGDFRLNLVQAQGGVKGTGTDFRFLGDLRAASARQGSTSIAGLFIDDALAEFRDGQLSGSAQRATASNVSTQSVRVSGAQVSGVRFSQQGENGFDASVASLSAGAVQAEGTRVNGVNASDITAVNRGGVTNVVVNNARVNGGTIAGAQLGSINVAGVRLAIFESGRIEGSTGDLNVGTIAFETGNAELGPGRVENVRLARPTFVVEPSGRYRASADLSLGGGVLGDIPLGSARAQVVATSSQIQLNNFVAEAMNGRAQGDAVISTARGGASRIDASFTDLDVGKLLALATGNSVPVTGAATGTINLSFPGTNVELASGTLNTRFDGETGNEASGRTPVNGDLVVRAERGQFAVERANLRAGATELNATGQFSFAGDSNLQVNLASTDAAELQRIAVNSGLLGDLEETFEAYGIELAGNLNFDGTVRGSLDAPSVNGRVSLGSLAANGRDLGALTASIQTTPNEVRIPDGRLVAAADGGQIQFALNLPLTEANTGTIEATLERYDLGRLLAALPISQSGLTSQLAAVGPTSGRISVTGFPGAMNGSADLRAGPGRIGDEPFQEIVAKATFNGSTINLETLDARLRSGRITASGTIDTETTQLDVRASGTDVNLNLVETLIGRASAAPALAGTFDFTANVSGSYAEPRSLQINFNGEGENVVVNGQQAGTLAIVGRTENQRLNVQLTTGLLGQPQTITAQVNLADENLPTTIETTLTNADLTQLFATLLPGADVRVTGTATGTLRAAGNLINEEDEFSIGALRGTAQFTDLTIQIEDVQLSAESPLLVQFSPEEIFFERTRFTGTGTNIVLGGTAALGPGGTQNFTVDGTLNLRVLNGLSPDVFVGGMARVGVRVGGTFADPQINGTVTVDDASFSTLIEDERLTAQNIGGAIRFTADRAQIDSLTGTLGGGRVSVTGGASIDGFALGQFRLNVLADNVTVPFPDDFSSTVDANLEVLQGIQPAQLIRGTINAQRVEYTEDIDLADFINREPEVEITEGIGGAFGGNVQLDLRVEGRDALIIRNNLADAVGSVALHIGGTLQEPQVSGRVTATRGTLIFRNDRYDITRAIINLPARRDADPVLNIQAESEIRGYNVIVTLTGPLSQPTALVRSDPALPQSDVVALITTGNLATGDGSASTLAQTGFGTATSLLTDTLINTPVQRATDRLFGLNRFEIDPLITGRGGASPTARLTVGRQINRNLSLTYSTNLTTDRNQVVLLEYRVSDRLSFVARYEQAPVNAIRSQDDNFSVEIRFRKRF